MTTDMAIRHKAISTRGNAQIARLALAESLELLNRAVADSEARETRARQELEDAKADASHWRSRLHLFKLAIKEVSP